MSGTLEHESSAETPALKVLGPRLVPQVATVEAARENIELALLSVIAHGRVAHGPAHPVHRARARVIRIADVHAVRQRVLQAPGQREHERERDQEPADWGANTGGAGRGGPPSPSL